jgi:hypothetical protein
MQLRAQGLSRLALPSGLRLSRRHAKRTVPPQPKFHKPSFVMFRADPRLYIAALHDGSGKGQEQALKNLALKFHASRNQGAKRPQCITKHY